jgi:hypothetical protein
MVGYLKSALSDIEREVPIYIPTEYEGVQFKMQRVTWVRCSMAWNFSDVSRNWYSFNLMGKQLAWIFFLLANRHVGTSQLKLSCFQAGR